MRFKTLDLVRYGAFADRRIDFGNGAIDLHLVVGPNEAGKSTMLAAISDFLFGIPSQSNQNWRFPYDQLRLRAVLEHGGETLELVRRKGSRNTLLNADDSPADAETLSRWLLGLDRQGFERMYGLDHAKLRSGGSMILEGRDEAARIVLEAGTGLGGIGDALKSYERTAAELFKSGGQNPVVNALMRQREAARADLREAMVGESDWKAVREKADTARHARDALIEEGKILAARAALLTRVQRVRGPLARLGDVEQTLETLGAAPTMPENARTELDQAQATLRTIEIKSEQLQGRLAKALDAAVGVVVNSVILAHASDILALDERRPVVEQAARDLGHRKSELAHVERTIATARAAAKLVGNALPSPGWMKRAATWLEATKTLANDQLRQDKARATLDKQIEKLAKDDPSGTTCDAEPLRLVLARYPLDAEVREVDARQAMERAQRRVAAALKSLAPWTGSAKELECLTLPNENVASDHAAGIENARAERDQAAADQKAAAIRARAAQADIDRLDARGLLPSIENVQSARDARDAVVVEIKSRLVGERSEGDAAVGAKLSDTVVEADRVVDQRESEAQRIAEHARAIVELEDATGQREDAEARQIRWTDELKQLESEWAARLQPLGFVEVVPATGFPAWRSAYGQCLATIEDFTVATNSFERLKNEAASTLAVIAGEASVIGAIIPSDAPAPQLVAIAQKRLREVDDANKARETTRIQRDAIADGEAQHGIEEDALARRNQLLSDEEKALLAEVAFEDELGAAAIADAVEALKDLTGHVAELSGFQRQIDGIERDAETFGADVRILARQLGEQDPPSASDAVREWTRQLSAAQDAKVQHARLQGDANDAQGGLDLLNDERTAAQQCLERLRGLAAVANDEALAAVIDAAELRQDMLAKQSEFLSEILAGGDALAIDAIRAEVATIASDDAVAELTDVAKRGDEIATEREEVAQSLSEAQRAIEDAGVDDAAADAQQRIVDISAQLAHAAEAHVAAASSAALLRWLIDKHRAMSQAPLMARAANAFAAVTRGAFANLGIDYGDDDRPRLIGVRADGSRVDATGMSEGTRDQLYLALRLAAIELRVGNTVPLICDDLLVTADDARAAAMFGVLATTAATTQVIVFTHHDHLVDVARNALGPDAFKLHRIDPAPRLAQAA